jgi:hypothetical protein
MVDRNGCARTPFEPVIRQQRVPRRDPVPARSILWGLRLIESCSVADSVLLERFHHCARGGVIGGTVGPVELLDRRAGVLSNHIEAANLEHRTRG